MTRADPAPAPSELAPESRAFLEEAGFTVKDESIWLEALTHGSFHSGAHSESGASRDYQRLEFLGDRVLGLAVAEWLYRASAKGEGQLSQRLNALVSGRICAHIARQIGMPPHIRLGKQAREDGGADSDNILGDVMEAVIGANFLDNGFEATRRVVYRLWDGELLGEAGRAKHPKSALQEWAAGNRRAMPQYEVTRREGPDHASRFTVAVKIHNVGAAEAQASSKSEAEKLAAKAFLEKFG
ncbi:ribonuclease III [Erythrobacter sp.]|uniref:ribonuclease III n=1 Tax=Erythrobacter sp. TaxID=1042 RepID=UPI002EBEA3A3|nr:ribonuclease III [Erythrobacter sp.]